jgi:DNA primase
MLTEGVSFPEAVERLAQQAGIPLPVMTREAQAQEERRKTLHEVAELAAKFFEATLASRAGARGRGYLLDRGIHAPTQLKFRLGYAAGEQYALKEHLGAAKTMGMVATKALGKRTGRRIGELMTVMNAL